MPWRSVVRRSTSCISAAVRAFIGKKLEYSVAREERLAQARDDDGHVIGLLGSASPLFGSGHQRFGDHERRCALQTDGGFLQPADSEFLADAEDHATCVQACGLAVTDEERGQVACIRVKEGPRGAVIDGDEKGGEAVV